MKSSLRGLRLGGLPRLLPLLLAAGLGCGGGDGRRPVFPVRGQVLYEGKPTPGAIVMFHPRADPDPDAPRPIARVNADGSFAPTTYASQDGAPAGEYAVTVTWIKEVDSRDVEGEVPNQLPDRYAKPKTSGIIVQVQKGDNNLAPFQLTRK
jgi:hypothetical protein